MKEMTILAVALATISPSPASAPPKSVGERIVAFCKANMDKQVGNGECASLATAALQAAGAKPKAKHRDSPNSGDYVWGKLVFYVEAGEPEPKRMGKEKDVQPGDIIQFRDARFEWKNGRSSHSQSCGHHTAVVVEVENEGTTFRVLHQNSNGKRAVGEGSFSPEHLKKGWMRIYRPSSK